MVEQTVGHSVARESPLMDAGLDSLASAELVSKVNSVFCVELSATLLFDYPSVSSISDHLGFELASACDQQTR